MLAKENKPILEAYKIKPELLPKKKMLTNEKAKNLKTCLLKTKTRIDFEFQNSTIKQNLRFKDDFVFALGCPTACVTGLWAGR